MIESPEKRRYLSRIQKWRISWERKRNLQRFAHLADERVIDWGWDQIPYNRLALVSKLIGAKRHPSYLEIGCANDVLFNSVPALHKVGVDPLSGGTIRDTSDNFFATNTQTFDVIFVDGLHTYHQVRRDINNSLAILNDGGWIAFHDSLPATWLEQHVPNMSRGDWTGDVWKVAFELAQTPGIEFRLARIDHGVGVLRKLTSGPIRLTDLRSDLDDRHFTYYFDNLASLPVTNFEDVAKWIESSN